MSSNGKDLPLGKHLGGGVVLFEQVFDLDWEWMRDYCKTVLQQERDTMYTPGVDPITGEDGYINRSGYFFKKDSVDEMPWRGSFVHQDSRQEVIDTLEYIEERRDACLLSYLEMFPIAGKCIWWKIKSHIVAYPVGGFLGMHADVSTDYEYGKPHPRDQLATRNTVSVVAYLNDSVESEEELDGTNFTGGAHNFAYLDIKHKDIKKGDMLFFPSNYVAAHEVQPVTGGWRYSYLGWYCQGTPNPDVCENVVDPQKEPFAASISTNVYMEHGYSILPPVG
jgi:hypothetical protein